MNCEAITQPAVVIEVLQCPEKKHLQANLFNCIYSLYQGSFLSWILNKYRHNQGRDKLWEDAKDAFQNGLSVFYLKSQQEGFNLKSSLKTTIYSFGFLQLLASFKKEKNVFGVTDYMNWVELFSDDEFSDKEGQDLINNREHCLLEALRMLPKKQQDILCMKFFQKFKSKQIAEILKVSPGNVDNESTRAYKELRGILKLKFNFNNQDQWN